LIHNGRLCKNIVTAILAPSLRVRQVFIETTSSVPLELTFEGVFGALQRAD
jgi:hypothetical protein